MTDRPTRRIDARSLRGIAHPLRMRILELLRLDGPATSARLAGRLGENTGTVSWHLRHLADHGFIEEEAGRGTKRERWWRAVDVLTEVNLADFRGDPGTSGAASVYTREIVRQFFGRVMDYLDEDWEGEWEGAGTLSGRHDLRLTADRLRALNAELAAVIERYATASPPAGETAEDARGALPVVVQFQAFPRKERDA